jgi:predicted lipoprotein
MKQIVTYIILLSLGFLSLTACHQEENDLFATAVINLAVDEGITITQVQAQAELTNVNTRQVTTTANFDGGILRVELLRGAYQILIEGVATCQDASGNIRLRQFRAQTDYVELVGTGSNATRLNLIFLD